MNKTTPCKDKSLKDVKSEIFTEQVSKIINENIIISSNIDSNSEEKTIKAKLKKNKSLNKDKDKDEIDYSYLRLTNNEILIELEKEDNTVKAELKNSILKMIDKGHNYLYYEFTIY